MDKEVWIASARMRTRCTRSSVLGMESTVLGNESTFLGIKTTLYGRNLKKQNFFLTGSRCALLSVVSRCSVGVFRQGIRKKKEMEILKIGVKYRVESVKKRDKTRE